MRDGYKVHAKFAVGVRHLFNDLGILLAMRARGAEKFKDIHLLWYKRVNGRALHPIGEFWKWNGGARKNFWLNAHEWRIMNWRGGWI